MSKHDEAVANARRQAVHMHAIDVLREEFNASMIRTRAADKTDPTPEEQATVADATVAERRKTLGRLARNNGTTPAKVMADATEAWESELGTLLVGWENELAVVEDMVAHPEEYGHKLLDGRPMDLDQLNQGVLALRVAIAHARQHLGLDDAPTGGKRAQR